MRRFLLLITVVALLMVGLEHPVTAAGTATVTTTDVVYNSRQRITKYSIAWTSTAGGAVSGNTFTVSAGKLLRIEFIPGSGGSQPSDAYDVTLVNANSVDVLAGGGANLSNAASTIQQWDPPLFMDGATTLDLVVANAGNAKTGTVVIYVEL